MVLVCYVYLTSCKFVLCFFVIVIVMGYDNRVLK